jgi:hypothetical protein
MMNPSQINYDNSDKILGLPEYLSYGQNERVDELNDRIQSRHFPDSPLEPNFSPRAVPTKYALFPIVNRRAPLNEPVIPYLTHNTRANFYQGTHAAPPSGYFEKIDTETILRNQHVTLQRGADQGVYIPSTNSDLYKVNVNFSSNQNEEQPHPLLFDRPLFERTINANVAGTQIGNDRFFNHTRTQLRNSTN